MILVITSHLRTRAITDYNYLSYLINTLDFNHPDTLASAAAATVRHMKKSQEETFTNQLVKDIENCAETDISYPVN